MTFELAQVNISRLLAPLDSPLLADFVAALHEVNVAGDRAPGFVWRLQTEDGDATAIRAFEWDAGDSHGVIVNLTDQRAPMVVDRGSGANSVVTTAVKAPVRRSTTTDTPNRRSPRPTRRSASGRRPFHRSRRSPPTR